MKNEENCVGGWAGWLVGSVSCGAHECSTEWHACLSVTYNG